MARSTMPRAAVTAAALLLAVLLGPAPAAAAPPPRAAVVFLQGPLPGADPPMIERLAAIPGLTAVGFVSSTQGAYTAEQMLLDVSAGARVTTSLYDGDLPSGVRFVQGGAGGHMAAWEGVLEHADTPPADIEPGALGGAVGAAGLAGSYAGRRGTANREAIVAADRGGGVPGASLYEPGRAGAAVLRSWRGSRFLVAVLPPGPEGRSTLEGLLATRRPRDLVLVVQQPRAPRRRLLAAGAAGLDGGSTLRSDSTRTDGLVLSTDIAPTVLDRLGVPVPEHMNGEPVEAAGDATAAVLDGRRARLAVVGPRRWAVTLGGLGGALALMVVWALVRRPPEEAVRDAARLALPAALWLPAVLLLTGALAPSAAVELAIVAVACAGFALAADALLRWPSAVALAAAVTIGLHLIDLALGSDLIARSLLGPNPLLGARFYGIGNELEAALSSIVLLGIGAAFAFASARARVLAFAVVGGGLALLLGWGRLGADVGAVLTLGVGAAAGALAASQSGPGRARAAAILTVPALAIALLAALDLATGGDSHFTRSVLRAGGLRELGEVAQRRFELSYTSLGRGVMGPLAVLAVVALAAGVRWRHRVLEPVAGAPGLVAGIWASLAAVVTGALTNDSGPIILLIGTTYLVLAVGFVAAVPKRPAGSPAEGSTEP